MRNFFATHRTATRTLLLVMALSTAIALVAGVVLALGATGRAAPGNVAPPSASSADSATGSRSTTPDVGLRAAANLLSDTADPVTFALSYARALFSYDTRGQTEAGWTAALTAGLDPTADVHADNLADLADRTPPATVWSTMTSSAQYASFTATRAWVPQLWTPNAAAYPAGAAAITVSGTQHVVWAREQRRPVVGDAAAGLPTVDQLVRGQPDPGTGAAMNPLLLLGGAAALVGTPVVGLMFLSGGSTAAHASSCGQPDTQTTLGPLTADQTANATIIVGIGEQMTVPAYGQVIAVATALQESGLHDLNYGDADSLGLFQQRPSQGWGAPAQILDPRYAATAFYNHLLTLPGWEALTLTRAAQTVQRSAFPDAYAKWQDQAAGIVQRLAGGSPLTAGSAPATDPGAGLACGLVDLAPGSVAKLVAFAAEQVGKPYLLGAAGPGAWDCSALVQAAYAAADVTLPRTADEQYDFAGADGQVFVGPPTAADLQPGDLLFSAGDDPVPAADGNPIGHVAIYAGNGVVIEAKGAAWGVISTTYTTAEFSSVTFVGRLVAQPGAQEVPPRAVGVVSSPTPASVSGLATPSPKGST